MEQSTWYIEYGMTESLSLTRIFMFLEETRAEFADCYETGKGTSGRTYQLGFRDAVKICEAKLAFYENVTGVVKGICNTTGKRCRPCIKVVEADMHKQTMNFQHGVLDSQSYLVAQRRSR